MTKGEVNVLGKNKKPPKNVLIVQCLLASVIFKHLGFYRSGRDNMNSR